MASLLEMPALYVEGQSDLHTIIQLLARHGITLDKGTGPVVVKDAKNDDGVLKAMATATKASSFQSVGFVLDADESLANRWQAVQDRLKDFELALPDCIPTEGFIGLIHEIQTQVGVWIMPDNQLELGSLEGLVQTLVPNNDRLFSYTRETTENARLHDAKFKNQKKAELHCWLAWQKDPGLSFGTAIKVKYLQHDSEVAKRFVQWFKNLFGEYLD